MTEPQHNNQSVQHTVRWEIDRDAVVGNVTCSAPVRASCRLRCPEGCEQWPCDHELVDSGQCNAVEWFDNDGVINCYGGATAPLRDGPICVWWEGDFYAWEYPDGAA